MERYINPEKQQRKVLLLQDLRENGHFFEQNVRIVVLVPYIVACYLLDFYQRLLKNLAFISDPEDQKPALRSRLGTNPYPPFELITDSDKCQFK